MGPLYTGPRYPQLYSRVVFVYRFGPLGPKETKEVVEEHRKKLGIGLPKSAFSDEEALAAIVRTTGGNFRLVQRLLQQIERLVRINGDEVVDVGSGPSSVNSVVLAVRGAAAAGFSEAVLGHRWVESEEGRRRYHRLEGLRGIKPVPVRRSPPSSRALRPREFESLVSACLSNIPALRARRWDGLPPVLPDRPGSPPPTPSPDDPVRMLLLIQ